MRASATIDVTPGRLGLRSEPPLTLRPTPGALYLVGSAAGPVGGDQLDLSVTLGSGTDLEVRSAAAAMHHPAPRPATSTLDTRMRIDAGARLRWRPEPGILIDGCDHRASTRVDLGAEATLVWREEWVLGRRGEPGGSVLSRLRVDRCGRPLLRSDQALGPRWPGSDGPAGVDGARAVGSLVIVGAPAGSVAPAARAPSPDDDCRWASLRIADDATVISAIADRPSPISTLFDQILDALATIAPSGVEADPTFPAAQPV